MDRIALSSKLKKYILASIIGNGLEWYDFVIFGYFSPVFSKQFFPEESQFVALINIFIIFAVGFLSRPLGAYFFGKLADQQGRKHALLMSVLLMATSTSLIGLLPTFATIGILAPLLLTVLRVCQGISMGGEFTSSLTFIVEHAPPSRRGFVGAWIYSGGFLGSAFGAIIAALSTLCIPSEQLQLWGWRLPFFLGFLIAFLGYYLRKRLDETPIFLDLQKTEAIEKFPFQKVLKENLAEILLIVGVMLPNAIWMNFLFVFLSNYLTQIMHWEFIISLMINLIPTSILMLLLPITGHLSDLIGRKKVILSGLMMLCILTPMAFRAISSNSCFDLILLQVLISCALALSYGPTAALLTEVFPAPLRNTGMSLSYHVGTGIFGGMTPLILTVLISYTDGVLWATLWMLLSLFVGIAAVAKIKELSETPKEVMNF